MSLPHRSISADTTEALDRSKLYVCYCDGIGCNASTKTALKLLTLGFQCASLIGGLDWWRRDGYLTHGLRGGGDGAPASFADAVDRSVAVDAVERLNCSDSASSFDDTQESW